MTPHARREHALRDVLIVDDEENIRHMLTVLLKRQGYEPVAVGSGQAALAELSARRYDVVLSDIRMPGFSGLELVDEVHRRELSTTVILMSAFGSVDVAIEAMKRGAYDYVSKPFRPDELVLVLKKAEERERLFRENQSLKDALKARERQSRPGLESMVTRSAKMDEIFRTVRKIAEHKTTALITGESGTGKELIARAIHALSPRKAAPFVAVNCGAIPESLVESELFGHKRGAFTDAVRDKKGLFEEAHGGTLLLDEVGELPLAAQVKLLRALQEQMIRPIGAAQDEAVDVRVVAATTRDLAEEVKAGRFREDLFYRLHVIAVHLPPLRERPEDIEPLAEHFIAQTSARLQLAVRKLSADALRCLLHYEWPGNVRELENTIERALVLCEGEMLTERDLSDRVRGAKPKIRDVFDSNDLSIKKAARVVEEELIRRALKQTAGNRTNAAKLLEISPRALLYKLKEYAIEEH